MLPIKLIRSITSDRRAQAIGEAISITNNRAALDYLNGTALRLHIEKSARVNLASVNGKHFENLAEKYPMGEKWIDKEWSTHFKAKSRRNKK